MKSSAYQYISLFFFTAVTLSCSWNGTVEIQYPEYQSPNPAPEVPVAQGNSWYVDNLAAGSNTGNSWSNAWQDFDQINWTAISPGDTLYISGGETSKVYGTPLEIIDKQLGTEQSWFHIRPGQDSGHQGQVIFESQLQFRVCQYINFDGSSQGSRGFLIRSPDSGINLYNSQNIRIAHTELTEIGDANNEHGVSVGYLSDLIVLDSLFIHDNVLYDGININTQLDNNAFEHFYIINSIIDNVGDDAIQCANDGLTIYNTSIKGRGNWTPGAHPDGIQTARGVSHFRIYNSTISGFTQDIFLEGIQGPFEIYNNILIGDGAEPGATPGRGLSMGPYLNDQQQSIFRGYGLITNNIFTNYRRYIAFQTRPDLFPSFTSDELIVENNIFYNNRHHFGGVEEYFGASNLFFNEEGLICRDQNSDALVPAVEDAPHEGTLSNPLFSDWTGGNYMPLGTSPAWQNGKNLSDFFDHDREDYPRPDEGNWDIGPYTDGR